MFKGFVLSVNNVETDAKNNPQLAKRKFGRILFCRRKFWQGILTMFLIAGPWTSKYEKFRILVANTPK